MAVSMIGFIFGPILGGHLSEYKNGYFYVCIVTSVLFFINICKCVHVAICRYFSLNELFKGNWDRLLQNIPNDPGDINPNKILTYGRSLEPINSSTRELSVMA